MNITTDTILQSERLIFEKINASHAREFERALCDPKVYQHIDTSCPTLSELHNFLRELESGPPSHKVDESWYDFAVRRTSDRQLIGRLEATIIGANAEVSYLFGSDFWGQGYAQESLTWLHQFATTSHSISSFWASIQPSNLRSIKLIEHMKYSEVSEEFWPKLTTYDPGDRVFRNQTSQNLQRTGRLRN